MMSHTMRRTAARPPTPPTTPPMIAPRFEFDLDALPAGTGTAVVGVTTAVAVLTTTVRDPPGSVEVDETRDKLVVGGRVDIEVELEEEDEDSCSERAELALECDCHCRGPKWLGVGASAVGAEAILELYVPANGSRILIASCL